MREILFRAKTEPYCKDVITGEILEKPKWIYGYIDLGYMRDGQGAIISDEKGNKAYRCQYSTIGQYTGLTDKNGKRIFEGDVIKSHYANARKADFVEEVVFHNGRFCAMYQKDGGKMWCPLADGVPHHPGDRTAYMEWCERIGTVHDNPELLEGGTANA